MHYANSGGVGGDWIPSVKSNGTRPFPNSNSLFIDRKRYVGASTKVASGP